jgi:hypothetical protein
MATAVCGITASSVRARNLSRWDDLEKVLRLYRELNVQYFHEKLREVHGIQYSYTCVNNALEEAGLVERRKKPGPHASGVRNGHCQA